MSTNAHTDVDALNAGSRAVRALHALSSSTLQLDPNESYYIVRDLLACVRHLTQVAQHAGAMSPAALGLKKLADAVSDHLAAAQEHLADAGTDLSAAADLAIYLFEFTPRRPITAEPSSLDPQPSANAPSPPRPSPAPPVPAHRDRSRQGPAL